MDLSAAGAFELVLSRVVVDEAALPFTTDPEDAPIFAAAPVARPDIVLSDDCRASHSPLAKTFWEQNTMTVESLIGKLRRSSGDLAPERHRIYSRAAGRTGCLFHSTGWHLDVRSLRARPEAKDLHPAPLPSREGEDRSERRGGYARP